MDLYRIIEELVEERNRVDQIIQSLESAVVTGKEPARPPARRRGRKSMDGPARKEVSERMKRYWAQRRADRAGEPEVRDLAISNAFVACAGNGHAASAAFLQSPEQRG